jgi:hypothetical protein
MTPDQRITDQLKLKQMNMRETIRLARQLGWTVEPCWRNGEIVFSHPLCLRPVRVNGRRKDTPRTVMTSIRQVYSISCSRNP